MLFTKISLTGLVKALAVSDSDKRILFFLVFRHKLLEIFKSRYELS